MKYQWIRIPTGYLVLSILFYLISFLYYEARAINPDSGIEQTFFHLERLFYWINMHVICLSAIMISSLIGMIYFYIKSGIGYAKGFAFVFSFSVACFLVLMILSLLQ